MKLTGQNLILQEKVLPKQTQKQEQHVVANLGLQELGSLLKPSVHFAIIGSEQKNIYGMVNKASWSLFM